MNLSHTAPEPAAWDAFAHAHAGHILQTSIWGAFKREFGWHDERVALIHQDAIVCGALVLYRPLPFGLGTLAYIPRGPVIDWQDRQHVSALLGALDAAARRKRAIALKIEPDIEDSPAMRELLRLLGFRPSPQTVQPPRTILLDIDAPEEVILARMNQGTRRKIRTAEKKDVRIRVGTSADMPSFNHLMQATGVRNTFGVHAPRYFERVYDLFAATGEAALLMASVQGRDLGGLMVFTSGERAWYFYGASADEGRERMPAYALQWEAIRWARARGCTVYDMWGVPDEDEAALEAQFQTRSDGLWGVYGFKRGFGGRVFRTIGAWDRVYNPLLYRAYSLALAARGMQD